MLPLSLIPHGPPTFSPPGKKLLVYERSTDWSAGVMARQVFAHFQNLNLRVLIEDLRRGQATRGNWSFAGDLCPVAHGLCDGQTVKRLQYVSQAIDLRRACELAGEQIGASPRRLYHVVTSWDAGSLGDDWLLRQLESIWAERLADAGAMQAILCGEPPRSPLRSPLRSPPRSPLLEPGHRSG